MDIVLLVIFIASDLLVVGCFAGVYGKKYKYKDVCC